MLSGVRGTVQSAVRASTMSGAGIAQHESFAGRSATALAHAALSDGSLGDHLDAAAEAATRGAARIDAISAQAQQTYAAAAVARTPGAQRNVLAALRSHLAQTTQVVEPTKRHAADLSSGVRALDYRDDRGNAGVQPVDYVIGGGKLPQEPPPSVPPPPVPPSPVTGPPIKYNPPPTTPKVIDASPPPENPGHQTGFPKCATSDNLKHIAEMLAGIALFGIAIPADLASLGAATPGLISGGYMGYDGFDELRKCTG